MSNPVLKLENVTMQFGGVVAVDNLSMEVGEGEIVALIGPNGAGKSTIMIIMEKTTRRKPLRSRGTSHVPIICF